MILLEPMRINGMTLPNRVVVPAMVTRLSGEDGFVNDAVMERYVRYAEGQVGLIVVEATAVHTARSGPLLRLGEDRFIPGHRELVRRVKAVSDSAIVPQIIHFLKIARSGWRQTIETLETAEIDAIVEAFGQAAARAREAGYDGVELHSAHAYTLSSFLSRLNRRRDEYGGRTLEGRLRLFGRVMARVRERVGSDFPVGVRFLADEAVKEGHTVEEAKWIALRFAQLGVDYISLSVGGKFEDAVRREGHPVYPYTGYSGDRCMPGAWYPDQPHAHYAAEVKAHLNAHGYTVPVVSVGKINDPEAAEALLREGKADLIGMARQLLTDPEWPRKVREGRGGEIVRCIYCNVCKKLDENFKQVTCFLWPSKAIQAPRARPGDEAPAWERQDSLRGRATDGTVKLSWSPALGEVAGYDIYRVDGLGQPSIVEAVKVNRFNDRSVLGGVKYAYHIKAFDSVGRTSPPSNTVRLEPAIPDLG